MKEKQLLISESVYLTALSTIEYIPGVKALKKSLLKVKSKHKLCILIPLDQKDSFLYSLNKEKILDEFCFAIYKPNIIFDWPQTVKCKTKNHHWKNTFFKLASSRCIEFKKIILIDSDMMVLRNIDHLFYKENFSAAVMGHAVNKWIDLNSGLMVLEPSMTLYNNLLKLIIPVIVERESSGECAGDQDVFKKYLPEWSKNTNLLLMENYNFYYRDFYRIKHFYKLRYNQFFVIHFADHYKPWSIEMRGQKNIKRIIFFAMKFKFYLVILYIKYIIYSK